MRFKIFLNLFQMCGFELKTLFVTFFNNFNQNFKNYRYTNKFSTQYKKIQLSNLCVAMCGFVLCLTKFKKFNIFCMSKIAHFKLHRQLHSSHFIPRSTQIQLINFCVVMSGNVWNSLAVYHTFLCGVWHNFRLVMN